MYKEQKRLLRKKKKNPRETETPKYEKRILETEKDVKSAFSLLNWADLLEFNMVSHTTLSGM